MYLAIYRYYFFNNFVNFSRNQFFDFSCCRYYYLNHFTTEQLVVLQNELAQLNSVTERAHISPRVYPLLAGVRGACTARELETAMRQAFARLAAEEREAMGAGEGGTGAGGEEEVETAVKEAEMEGADSKEREREEEQRKEFLETMEGSFSERLAVRALKAVGTDIDAG